MRIFIHKFLLTILVLFSAQSAQADESLDYSIFSEIPILHDGRVKPLDTFARINLLTISGKESLGEMNAISWLAETIFNQQKGYDRRVFNVPNPDVVNAIGLTPRKKHLYSFNEISFAIKRNAELVTELDQKATNERTLAQNQLIILYQKTLIYFDISRSLSLISPNFIIKNKSVANRMGITPDKRFTYFEMMEHYTEFLQLTGELLKKPKEHEFNDEEISLLKLAQTMKIMDEDKKTQSFRIIPPQWGKKDGLWTSPWASLQDGYGSPKSAEYIQLWRQVAEAYRTGDGDKWLAATAMLHKNAYNMAGSYADSDIQHMEVLYNYTDLFKISLILYILSFAILALGAVLWKTHNRQIFQKTSFYTLCIGVMLHFGGMVLRITIMSRPPVATLYESIIFVALIGVLFAIYIERKRKDGVGVMVGALLGTVLMFIGRKYAAEGDTMGMLVAVLDTNFWLATHVVAITIGYGGCLVAGTFGHIYLIQLYRRPKDHITLKSLQKNTLGIGLIALFFSLFGTILGGIWADQSWGRFWGWDPKENGAMLIVLWLIWLLHGRIAGKLSPTYFALGMCFTNIIVILAWFGVNLLNVGLHSYGYTTNIATNIGIFCGAELLFIVNMFILLSMKEKSS